MSTEIAVAIVEDQRQTREGLAALVGGTPGHRLLGAFGSVEEALARLGGEAPDVLLLDIGLPGMSGIDGVARFKERYPELQILILTVFADDDHVFAAICAGASGYVLKDTPPARLLSYLDELSQGGAPMSPEIARKVVTMFRRVAPPARGAAQDLSPRELDVLRLLTEGHSYKTAAAQLAVSLDTVRFHVRNIYEKLHVHSKSEAVVRALRSGLLAD